MSEISPDFTRLLYLNDCSHVDQDLGNLEYQLSLANVSRILALAIRALRERFGQHSLSVIEGVELRRITEDVVKRKHIELDLFDKGHIKNARTLINAHIEVVLEFLQGYGIDIAQIPSAVRYQHDWRSDEPLMEYVRRLRERAHMP